MVDQKPRPTPLYLKHLQKLSEIGLNKHTDSAQLPQNNNHLQQLCREIIDFYFTYGSRDQFGPSNYHERSEEYFAGQIFCAHIGNITQLVKGTRGEVKFLISQRSCCTQFIVF